MPEYQFLGETNAVPYDAFGHVVMRRFIDVADLILHPEKLALAASPNTPLTTFPGFVSGAILNVFHVPAGFCGHSGGVYIESADSTQPSATIAMGDGDHTAGWMAAVALSDPSWQGTIPADAYGSASYDNYGYIVADTIDILHAVQPTIDAKYHVYMMGVKAFDLLGADV